MKHPLPFFFFLLSCTLSLAQQPNVTIHFRVDTTKQEIKEIASLWTNYLNSQPDSIYDNPYWNEAEKQHYKDFDFSRAYMYQLPSKQLLNYYSPTILSIEKEGDNYAIRTMFAAEGLEGIYRKSNPWCITKLYAIKENNKWKLKNALPILTQNWKRKTVGKITFIYPAQHTFNDTLAQKANKFCDRIAKDFQFPDWKPFDFYITENGDELGKLLNFDFYAAGYTTGIGMNDNRILLGGFGSEYYPHEFVHLIAPRVNRHYLIEEGFATWQGGVMEKTFEESAKILASQIALNDTVTFLDILDKKWGWQYAAYYTTGAIFCKLVYDKGGITALKKLLEIPPDNGKLVESISTLIGINKNDLDSFWRRETLRYLKN
ncbi:MAG: hypothetical protein JNL60_07275 [Bacteroidia bacterium]|nr:hypothetical protein [Bacteroidia bacterium]